MFQYFTVTLAGSGETLNECWLDAIDNLAIDPGPPPDPDEFEDDDE